ncbi:MAG: hypothetical protein ACKKMW_02050 [Candidatus Nealsonbacteria bacterium]
MKKNKLKLKYIYESNSEALNNALDLMADDFRKNINKYSQKLKKVKNQSIRLGSNELKIKS